MKKPRISLAASGASTWTVCTASPIFLAQEYVKGSIQKEETVFANEGDKAHKLAAEMMLMGVDDEDIEDKVMLGHIKDLHKFTNERKESFTKRGAVEEYVEKEVSVWFFPERKGYIDHSLLGEKHLYITDLKYGEGVSVHARGNKQLAIYGKSLLEEISLERDIPDDMLITLCIWQPRVRSGEKVSIWALTVSELNDFVNKEIVPHAENILAHWDAICQDIATDLLPPLEFKPSDSVCQFCDAQHVCKARAVWLLGGAEAVEGLSLIDALEQGASKLVSLEDTEAHLFGDEPDLKEHLATGEVILLDGNTMDPKVLSTLLLHKTKIVGWLNKLEAYGISQIEGGHPENVPGLKVVPGKDGNRTWTNEEEAAKLLACKLPVNDRYVRHVISVAEAEKRLKGMELSTRFTNRFKELTTRPPGKTKKLVATSEPTDHEDLEQSEFENLEDNSLLD